MSDKSHMISAKPSGRTDRFLEGGSSRTFTLDPRRLLAEVVPIGDMIVCTLVSVIVHQFYSFWVFGYFPDVANGAVIGLVIGMLTMLFGFDRKIYTFQHIIQLNSQLKNLSRVWLNVVFATIAIAFLLKISNDLSRGSMILTFSLGFAALLGYRAALRAFVLTYGRSHDSFQSRIALVGATSSASKFVDQMHKAVADKNDLVQLVGVYDDRAKARSEALNFDIAGSTDDLLDDAKNGRIDQIVIALPWLAVDRLEQIADKLSNVPVPVRLCPEGIAYSWNTRDVERLGDIDMVDVSSRSIDGLSGAMKFIIDRVGSAILLLLASPVLAAVALAIKMDSQGPVIFRQRRHGFNHKSFYVWKFRTMTVMEDGDVVNQASKDDKRVTRVGAILRKTSLDELPQLYNVLIGEMSLVGPRPHALAHNDKYSQMLRGYARRHNVIPGITGLAQAKGFRGETDTLDKMEKRLEYDLQYIDNWSLLLDIKILVQTVGALLFPKNSY